MDFDLISSSYGLSKYKYYNYRTKKLSAKLEFFYMTNFEALYRMNF